MKVTNHKPYLPWNAPQPSAEAAESRTPNQNIRAAFDKVWKYKHGLEETRRARSSGVTPVELGVELGKVPSSD